MAVHSHLKLRELMQLILEAANTPPSLAQVVSDSLVDANLAGHDSHGVIRIIQYLDQVQCGALDPAAEAEVVHRDGSVARVDGKWGWGQPAMHLATQEAIELARANGLGMSVVDRGYHVGRVAPYVETVARENMIALAMANAGAAVAPYGARSRVMGTNPIAWAVPRGNGETPVSLDIATAFIAEGKLRVARAKGLPAPPGAVVNVEGVPSLNPSDFYDGGALMAFGAHKGSGFSILAQMLGRGLAGLTPERTAEHRGANGAVILVIDPARLTPLEQFFTEIGRQVNEIHDAQPAEGFSEVLLPGEPEVAERAQRERDGIDVPDQTWAELLRVATDWGVPLPGWVSGATRSKVNVG
ncbi:malate/lactate/ureidoglycolate dehydrogenase [soil metagenome]